MTSLVFLAVYSLIQIRINFLLHKRLCRLERNNL